MKVLQVMAGAKHGGAETAFVDMCIAMHQAGIEIEVVTRANPIRVPRLQQAGIKVHTLPFAGKFDIYTRYALKKIIKHFQPEIIQCWMSRACQHTPAWSANMNIPVYQLVGRLGSPYKLKYFRHISHFVALTPALAQYLENNGINRKNICQIPNFAEVEAIENPVSRADFGTPKGAPLILGLGRLHPDKAFDTLIKVAAQLPDIHVWIAGEGPQREELEAMIRERQLTDRVKLLGWRTDRAALLQAADICAFVSRNEGFGTVFIQCWAQQTTLLVSDADGPRQFVRHEQDGLIAGIDNVEEIAAGIQRLIAQPALAAQLRDKGFQRYQQDFTKTAVVKAYLDFYRDISAAQHI